MTEAYEDYTSNHPQLFQLYLAIDRALESGEFDRARENLEKAYQLCNNPRDYRGLVGFILERVNGILEQGLVELTDLLQVMLSLAERASDKSGDQELSLEVLAVKGRCLSESGCNDEAAEVFANLARQAEAADFPSLAAEGWHGLGVAHHAMANYRKAGEYLQKAIELFTRLGNESKQAYSLYTLGMVALDSGRVDEALLAYEQAAAILFRIGDGQQLARVWHEQCICYLEQGRYQQALAKNDQVLQFYEQQGMDLKHALLVRIEILFVLGEIAGARMILENYFQDELAEPQDGFGYFLRFWQGIILAHSGQLQDGIHLLIDTAAIYREEGEFDQEAAINLLAGLYLILNGEPEKAEEQWRQSNVDPACRKKQAWLCGLLRRCLDRIELDFAGKGSATPEFGEQVRKGLRLCGF